MPVSPALEADAYCYDIEVVTVKLLVPFLRLHACMRQRVWGNVYEAMCDVERCASFFMR